MSEIGPLILDPFMRFPEFSSGFGSIFRTFDFSAQTSTQSFDLPFTLTEKFRSRLFVSRVRYDHIFQSKINSGAVRNENLCGFFSDTFSIDRNGPLSTMISPKSCPFDRSLDLSTLDHLHVAEFGNQHFSIFDLDILGNSKRLNRLVLLFELWKSGSLFKISIERSIYILNGLLRNLRWNIVQPFVFRSLLHLSDLFLNLSGCDRFSSFFVDRFLSSKSIVVGESRSASELPESFVLLLCQFKPKLECFFDLHFHPIEIYKI